MLSPLQEFCEYFAEDRDWVLHLDCEYFDAALCALLCAVLWAVLQGCGALLSAVWLFDCHWESVLLEGGGVEGECS